MNSCYKSYKSYKSPLVAPEGPKNAFPLKLSLLQVPISRPRPFTLSRVSFFCVFRRWFVNWVRGNLKFKFLHRWTPLMPPPSSQSKFYFWPSKIEEKKRSKDLWSTAQRDTGRVTRDLRVVQKRRRKTKTHLSQWLMALRDLAGNVQGGFWGETAPSRSQYGAMTNGVSRC